jgi:hypothetical protein
MNGVAFNVFTHREQLLHALRTREGLPEVARRMASASFLCALLYGCVLGAQIGGWQVLSSPVKFPLILVGTCGICIGALYVLLAVAGARLDWLQVTCLALCSVTASGLTMAALLPISTFWSFVFHAGPSSSREPVTLIHCAAFFIAGTVGTRFGLEMTQALFPERRMLRVMLAWMWIYGLVAQQMAWLFRPHFHATDVFMRPLSTGGSALETIGRILLGWLR